VPLSDSTKSQDAALIPDGAPPDPNAHGPFAAMRRMLPSGEVIRFLMVGVFNTGFSLGVYSLCVLLFGRAFPHVTKPILADIASIVSQPICITVAFLCYKHFVFRTKGNYLKEWLRCFAVYSVAIVGSLAILPAATKFFLLFASLREHWPNAAPILAGFVNSAIIACYSYFGHKKFSFKR
jgi:putative flippase GtrA